MVNSSTLFFFLGYKKDIFFEELAELHPPNYDIPPERFMFMIPSRAPPVLCEQKKWSKDLHDFVAKCLNKDPTQRLEAWELLDHALVQNTKSVIVLEDLVSEHYKVISAAGGRDKAFGVAEERLRKEMVANGETVEEERKEKEEELDEEQLDAMAMFDEDDVVAVSEEEEEKGGEEEKKRDASYKPAFMQYFEQNVPKEESKVMTEDTDVGGRVRGSKLINVSDISAYYTCSTCGKAVSGTVLRALDKPFHPECFRCIVCNCDLQEQKFFERHGSPYCKKHNTLLFGQICFRCGQEIPSIQLVHEMDRYWHRDHFACMICDAKHPISLYCLDNKPYCKSHYNDMTKPVCGWCRLSMEHTDNFLTAHDRSWHPTCFYKYIASKQSPSHNTSLPEITSGTSVPDLSEIGGPRKKTSGGSLKLTSGEKSEVLKKGNSVKRRIIKRIRKKISPNSSFQEPEKCDTSPVLKDNPRMHEMKGKSPKALSSSESVKIPDKALFLGRGSLGAVTKIEKSTPLKSGLVQPLSTLARKSSDSVSVVSPLSPKSPPKQASPTVNFPSPESSSPPTASKKVLKREEKRIPLKSSKEGVKSMPSLVRNDSSSPPSSSPPSPAKQSKESPEKQDRLFLFLSQMGQHHHYQHFLDGGFETPESLFSLRECDLIPLKVLKLDERKHILKAIGTDLSKFVNAHPATPKSPGKVDALKFQQFLSNLKGGAHKITKKRAFCIRCGSKLRGEIVCKECGAKNVSTGETKKISKLGEKDKEKDSKDHK